MIWVEMTWNEIRKNENRNKMILMDDNERRRDEMRWLQMNSDYFEWDQLRWDQMRWDEMRVRWLRRGRGEERGSTFMWYITLNRPLLRDHALCTRAALNTFAKAKRTPASKLAFVTWLQNTSETTYILHKVKTQGLQDLLPRETSFSQGFHC